MLTDVIKTALEQIQTIAKTETIIGEPIISGSVTLIPVSRVSIGFAAGGGVTITPIAFITIINDRVQVLPVEKNDPGLGKILAMAPDIISKISKFMNKDKDSPDK
jgi:uncharacterized spore protein YtfJ